LVKKGAATESSCTPGEGTVLIIQKPLVGSHVLMEPHGVIETGYLEILVSPIYRVGSITGVDECHVRRVGEQTLIQSLIVGHGIDGFNPDPLVGRHWHRRVVSHRVDITHFDRPRSLTEVLGCIGVVFDVFLE